MRSLAVAAGVAAVTATQLNFYEYSNCTGAVVGTVYMAKNKCTSIYGNVTVGMTTCDDSTGKFTLATYNQPNCQTPVADVLYDVPGTVNGCYAPTTTLINYVGGKGMKLMNSVCNLALTTIELDNQVLCPSPPYYKGLIPDGGDDVCWNAAKSYAVYLANYDSAGQRYGTMQVWYNADGASCNMTSVDTLQSEIMPGTPVNKGDCAMLPPAGDSLVTWYVKWGASAPSAYDPASTGSAMPTGIPKGSLQPIKCYKGNNSVGTITLQDAPETDTRICSAGDYTCSDLLPADLLNSPGICFQDDITAKKNVRVYSASQGSAWWYTMRMQEINCTNGAGCPVFRNTQFCNSDGCNAPPKGNGATGPTMHSGVLSALLVAAVTLLVHGRAAEQ